MNQIGAHNHLLERTQMAKLQGEGLLLLTLLSGNYRTRTGEASGAPCLRVSASSSALGGG